MNETIMRQAGFGRQVDAVRQGNCPLCGKPITGPIDFRDPISLREYQISGMCQACQDGFFHSEEA